MGFLPRGTRGHVSQLRLAQLKVAKKAWSLFAVVACVVWLGMASGARADQPRDYMLRLQPSGTFALIDFFGTGFQATLQHSADIYGTLNNLQVRANVLAMYPLGEAGFGFDLRILILRLSGDFALRSVWRDLAFAPGERTDRAARAERDVPFAGDTTSDSYSVAEGRAELVIPFNRHLLVTTLGALRYEGPHPTSFDWLWAYVHDSGFIPRWDMQIWLHHRDWGGFGPYVEILSLPRTNERQLVWAFGITAVTRAGLLTRRDDLVYFSFRIRPGDDEFGQHSLGAPVRGILVYRVALPL